MDPQDRCRLYLITPPTFDPASLAEELSRVLDAGDVACLQLRLKDASRDVWTAAAEALMPLCHEREVAFLINDHPDLAAQIGADGCHVGQQDTSYDEARALAGADRIVGVTCHNSIDLAMEAAERGADYVAFGAFFPTQTKSPKSSADPEILRRWSTMTVVPSVAIGGITAGNCMPLARAGADFVAVVGGVWEHPDGPAAAVAEFNRALERAAS